MIKKLYELGIDFSVKVMKLKEPMKDGCEVGVLLTFEKDNKAIESFETIMDIDTIERSGGMNTFLELYFGCIIDCIEKSFDEYESIFN